MKTPKLKRKTVIVLLVIFGIVFALVIIQLDVNRIRLKEESAHQRSEAVLHIHQMLENYKNRRGKFPILEPEPFRKFLTEEANMTLGRDYEPWQNRDWLEGASQFSYSSDGDSYLFYFARRLRKDGILPIDSMIIYKANPEGVAYTIVDNVEPQDLEYDKYKYRRID